MKVMKVMEVMSVGEERTFRVSRSRTATQGHVSLIGHFSLLITHCSLPIAHFSFLITHCSFLPALTVITAITSITSITSTQAFPYPAAK